MASSAQGGEEVASCRLRDLREHCELPFLRFILTEAAKRTCKLVCEPQRVGEKEFSKTSPLLREKKGVYEREGRNSGKPNKTMHLRL